MRFSWKGRWRNGEILIEAETLEELNSILDKLFGSSETQATSQKVTSIIPVLPAGHSCSDAIRTLMASEWGKQPKSMAEIRNALEANALYFSKGTLSGTLSFLTEHGDLRRFKSAGTWVYTAK
ncbi:hypothetical protein MUP77_11055 [Candidatus Bathyarchaeota archaeon]|nr:hypothetical protein [Candidatus Bathyarchaeota archaeon]